MDRREMLGVLSAGAATVVTFVGGAACGESVAHEHDGHIKIMDECAKVCNEASQHCLVEATKGGSHAEHHAKSHVATIDCQAFCTLTAALMARNSPMAKYAHQACADACRDCAAACEGQTAEIMVECVKACRDCEKVCRQMSGSSR